MSVQQIDRSRSTGSFEPLTRTSVGKRAGSGLASLGIGDWVEPEWAPQIGLTPDPEDDRIDVALAETFRITDEGLKNPTSEDWERACRLFDRLL